MAAEYLRNSFCHKNSSIKAFPGLLNNEVSSIKFTKEVEHKVLFPFLDMLIIHPVENGSFL